MLLYRKKVILRGEGLLSLSYVVLTSWDRADYIAQAGHKLSAVLVPQLSEWWDGYVLPCLEHGWTRSVCVCVPVCAQAHTFSPERQRVVFGFFFFKKRCWFCLGFFGWGVSRQGFAVATELVLELFLYTRLALNSSRSACLRLSAGVKGATTPSSKAIFKVYIPLFSVLFEIGLTI